MYRLAQTAAVPVAAGLFQWRHSREGERRSLERAAPGLFGTAPDTREEAKYRRQSFHHSLSFDTRWILPWNKSMSEESVVYKSAERRELMRTLERVGVGRSGASFHAQVEAVPARFQPEAVPADHPNMMVLLVPA